MIDPSALKAGDPCPLCGANLVKSGYKVDSSRSQLGCKQMAIWRGHSEYVCAHFEVFEQGYSKAIVNTYWLRYHYADEAKGEMRVFSGYGNSILMPIIPLAPLPEMEARFKVLLAYQ